MNPFCDSPGLDGQIRGPDEFYRVDFHAVVVQFVTGVLEAPVDDLRRDPSRGWRGLAPFPRSSCGWGGSAAGSFRTPLHSCSRGLLPGCSGIGGSRSPTDPATGRLGDCRRRSRGWCPVYRLRVITCFRRLCTGRSSSGWFTERGLERGRHVRALGRERESASVVASSGRRHRRSGRPCRGRRRGWASFSLCPQEFLSVHRDGSGLFCASAVRVDCRCRGVFVAGGKSANPGWYRDLCWGLAGCSRRGLVSSRGFPCGRVFHIPRGVLKDPIGLLRLACES